VKTIEQIRAEQVSCLEVIDEMSKTSTLAPKMFNLGLEVAALLHEESSVLYKMRGGKVFADMEKAWADNILMLKKDV
jgi:hypothetical protein